MFVTQFSHFLLFPISTPELSEKPEKTALHECSYHDIPKECKDHQLEQIHWCFNLQSSVKTH